jgi:hypothetical protein
MTAFPSPADLRATRMPIAVRAPRRNIEGWPDIHNVIAGLKADVRRL